MINFDFDGIFRRFPTLRAGVFGRSVMGRPLRFFSFGAGPRAAVFTAAHHANEWITAPALINCAGALAAGYAAGDPDSERIFRKTRLYFIPLVNPDGAALVTGRLAHGRFHDSAKSIAAAYPNLPFPSGWKANIRGVDLNLQYPAGWDEAKRIKYSQGWTRPAPRDYVGRAPLCASESRALYTFTRRVRPACVLALHTQGEVIYWQYKGSAPPGARALAERLAAASGYALDTVPDESSNAGYRDWAIEALGIPAFTVECGLGENPLPLSQLDGISAAAAGICRELAEYCAGG